MDQGQQQAHLYIGLQVLIHYMPILGMAQSSILITATIRYIDIHHQGINCSQ